MKLVKQKVKARSTECNLSEKNTLESQWRRQDFDEGGANLGNFRLEATPLYYVTSCGSHVRLRNMYYTSVCLQISKNILSRDTQGAQNCQVSSKLDVQ